MLVLGGSATSKAVVPELDAVGVRVRQVPMTDYGAACVLLASNVTDDLWRHLGDENAARAVDGAATRDTGDGGSWRWSPKDSTCDIAPLAALTLARWGLTGEATYDASASFG